MKTTWKMVDFLRVLKDCFEIRRLKDYKKPKTRSICLLRHDVDHDIDKALQIGKIEHSLNIQSTYFVLHGAKYYKNKNFIKNCLKLQDMGHEIGFHNNVLTVAMKTGRKPKDILEKELSYLRNNGIIIYGIVAHGDYACRKFNYVNYEIFKGCCPSYRKNRSQFKGIEVHNLKLSDYNLYEAYFLPRDYYVTDCRGTWRYIKDKSDEWHPNFQKHSPKFENIIPFLKKISKNNIILQALLHPNPKLINI